MNATYDFFAGLPYGNHLPATGLVRGGGARRWCLLQAARVLREGGKVTVRCHDDGEVAAFTKALREPLPGPQIAAVPPTVFGQLDFAATVGLWLAYAGRPAAALLSPYISTEGFVFNPAEYLELKERIDLTRRRYDRLPPVSKALEDLNTGFFRYRSLEESRAFITDRLTDYLDRAQALLRDYQLVTNGYARASLLAARRQQRAWELALDKLLATARAGEEKQGNRKRYAQLAKAWARYRTNFRPGAATTFPRKATAWLAFLAGETELLQEKKRTLVRENRAAALALSPVTANPDFVDPSRLKELATRLQNLIREIDEAGLYQLPLGGTDAATTPRQLQLLTTVRERLQNTRRHLPELADFYARRHFWYEQPAHLRRLLAPLLALPAADWEAAFSAWYFERCLERAVPSIKEKVVPSQPPLILKEPGARLRAFAAAVESPTPREPAEVFVDLTGGELPPAWAEHPSLGWRPLQATAATAIALAEVLFPTLLFLQTFTPEKAPAWSAIYVQEPPPTGGTGLRFQARDTADWQPYTTWEREPHAQLRWYFPTELTPEEATFLLREWPLLLATAPRVSIFHAWTPHRITQALLSDGFSADFIVAAFLRAAEAADTAPFDRMALVAIGREVRTRCQLPEHTVHP
ncbi:MAG: hypothetical protein AAFZ52_13995, partial [Bacteroidota bacterium]